MEKTMENAKDLHVRVRTVYGKAADHKLYYDSKYTTQVTKADAEDAFKKGMLLIVDTTTTLVPVAMTGTTVKTVAGSSTAATLVDWAVAAGD